MLRSDSEIRLPLDEYLLEARDQYVLSRAINVLARECLKRYGLTWPATPPWVGGSQLRNSRRYSIIEPEQARSAGYHPVDLLKRHRAIAEQEAALPQPAQDAVAVWSGTGVATYRGRPVPDGGCAGEATRRLSDDVSVPDPDLAQRLQMQTFSAAKTDRRVRAVFASWRECMSRRGSSYPDPFTAADDKRWRSEDVSATEITVASDDVECKQQTNLTGTMFAVETAYQRLAVKNNSAQLAALRTYLTTQLGNARPLVPE